jgi:hypothetical protein
MNDKLKKKKYSDGSGGDRSRYHLVVCLKGTTEISVRITGFAAKI